MGTANFKIINGTPIGESLCKTCRNATRVQGFAESQEIIHCESLNKVVPFPVFKCSEYRDRMHPTEWEFKQMAWILRSKGDRLIGFVPPKKHQEDDE